MYVNIGSVWLTDTKPETFCQAYHAGQIYSMVENFLPTEVIPSFVECMQKFSALRELFGERLWQQLKTRSKFRSRIQVYEMLTYQPGLPKTIIGTHREFCLGYAYNHKKTKVKKNLDRERTQSIQQVVDYLSQSQ